MSSKQSFSFEDINEGEERVTVEKDEDSAFDLKGDGKDRRRKPEVWIRVRPSPNIQDNIFDVTEDGKGVRLIPGTLNDPYNHRQKHTYREQRDEQGYTFTCDGVLRNRSQEETYQLVAHDLVDKAMDGISGLILCVGPELSGKHFTLFGSISKFQYRGIIPRCLERIFQVSESRTMEMRYLIRMAIIEIRHDKIRDLLTLGSFDGNSFNTDAPHGMVFQKIGAAEHGLGLLIRALTCQKEIPREHFAKPHTIVFIDIYGESYVDGGVGGQGSNPRVVKSRITFTKTAPIPKRDEVFATHCESSTLDAYGCCMQSSSFADQQRVKNNVTCITSSYSGSTCNSMMCAKRKTGPVAEAIRIRQDIGYVEQMCSRACQYQKFTKYYEKFASVGMTIPPPPPASQHYRLSKLTYCLKDIVSGNAEIRVLLHIRPEKWYKHATLEAMRFAEKAKCVPYGMGPPPPRDKREKPLHFGKELSVLDFLSKMPPEVSDLYIHVSPGTFKLLRDHASALFDGKIHAMSNMGELQVQELFDKLKNIWNYVMETGLIPTQIPPNTSHRLESSESLLGSDRHRRSTGKKGASLVNVLSKTPLDTHTKPSHHLVETPTAEAVPVTTKKSKTGKFKTYIKDKESGKKKKKSKKNKTEENSRIASAQPSAAEMETEGKEGHSSHISGSETPGTSKPNTPATDKKHDKIRTVTPDKNKTAIEEALGSDEETTRGLESREVPTKQEAWNGFLNTDNGSHIFDDLTQKNKVLQELAVENNTWIKEASQILLDLSKTQMKLSLIQQDRFLKGEEYDGEGNVIVSPKEKQLKKEIKNLETRRGEFATKLKNIRSQLFTQKNLVEKGKAEVENALQTFALDNYATTYGDHLDMTEMVKESVKNLQTFDKDVDDERIRKFEDIKRVAKKQARLFLRALSKKPSWVPY